MRRVALWLHAQSADSLQEALRRLGRVGIDSESRALLVGRQGFERRQLSTQDREVLSSAKMWSAVTQCVLRDRNHSANGPN